jgi:hypothetical protein
MLFSISVSFTNKHVNHTVIFELKKLNKKIIIIMIIIIIINWMN